MTTCKFVNDDDISIDDLPGFSHLTAEVQTLLKAVDSGDDDERPALLARAAEVVDVFAALGLLQFVFMPENDESDGDKVEVNLIDPEADGEEAIAWFSVDEAGLGEDRDAVLLFGSLQEIYNAPIVLDIEDEDDEEGGVEIDGPGENGHSPSPP